MEILYRKISPGLKMAPSRQECISILRTHFLKVTGFVITLVKRDWDGRGWRSEQEIPLFKVNFKELPMGFTKVLSG